MAETNTSNIGFEKQIWDAACVLRGNLDASEYKSVVLGLIFLKYISDRFETKYQELVDEGDGFEEDKDEYTAENIFFVPENARWSVIAGAAHTPEIGTIIDEAMRSIEQENKRLKDILPKNFARQELDKRRLGDVVDLFTNIQMVEHGNIVIVRTGKPGACTVIPQKTEPWNCSDLVIIHPNKEKINPHFLASYINLASGVINAHLVGAVQQHFNVGAAKKMKIPLPSIDIQNRIASIIQGLNDKIELNNKINENLQQQVQAIYQAWFGNINMEQEQGTLADICTYSKDRVSVSELDISTYFSTENMLPGKAGAVEASNLPTTAQTTACHVGDTLISNIRPYFKKIVYCHEECGCSTDVLCFVPVHSKYSAYLYSTLYADRFFDFMVAGSKGTKMPRGDKQQIMTYPVTLSTDTELERFNSVAVPILTQIQNNRNENKRLSLLRDTLLPKLMSGEIYI